MTRHHWLGVGGYGLAITLSALGGFALALARLGMGEARAVTLSFLSLALAQLWHVFNMRDRGMLALGMSLVLLAMGQTLKQVDVG